MCVEGEGQSYFFFQIIISLVTFSLDFGLLCDK